MKKNQKGIALVESLLILVIIALLAGTGYYVWHSNKQTNEALNNAASQKIASPTKKTTKIVAAPTSTQQYLVIKEWGVKVPLSATNSDAYYAVDTDNSSSIFLSLKKWDKTECGVGDGGIGSYFRFTTGEINGVSGATYLSENPNATKLGSFYYIFNSSQQGCSTTSATADPTNADVAAILPVRQAFKQDISKVQTL